VIRKIRSFFTTKNNYLNLIPEVHQSLLSNHKSFRVNLGQIQSRLNSQWPAVDDIRQVEFQVFSQWGDDGIIQYLVSKLDIPNKTFIEFGVEDYRESNTRFLLINNTWHGLVMDGSEKNVDFIRRDQISYNYHLHAKQAFVTKENINVLLIENFLNKGYASEIGLLSIDIDGNDYWIWQEIAVLQPIIVIVEYNAAFGPTNKWVVPYKADWKGPVEHHSRAYWGASVNAFCDLGARKGYSFIGCNSNGNNAYFIRNDKLGSLRAKTSEEGFVDASFRLYENDKGEKLGGRGAAHLLKGLKVFDIDKDAVVPVWGGLL
jgi:hypothetical protein